MIETGKKGTRNLCERRAAALLRVGLILVGAIWRCVCRGHRVGGASSSEAVKSIMPARAFGLAAAAAFIAAATLAIVAVPPIGL